MENDAHSMALPGPNAAHSMAESDAIEASPTLNWTVMNGKRDGISLTPRNHLGSRRHAGTLFCEHEFTARKIFGWFREENGDLYRKDVLAVEVLVKAVVVTRFILEEQPSWPDLSRFVTTLNEAGVVSE
jgi:hypothetical protein